MVRALLLVVAALVGAAPGSARHGRPVPILMYHVIAAAPAGRAYPQLFVRPADFSGQMRWLARHGDHAVTLRQVYDYWRSGVKLPSRPVVISFDDGYLSDDTKALPVLRKLHWPGVLNLKVNNLLSRYTLPPWRVRGVIAAGAGFAAHTPPHPELTTPTHTRVLDEGRGR